MAHYIADLIDTAESANEHDKRSAEKICFDAILTLWRHRAELPTGKRPFESLEPIARAIESLDPDNNVPRYFRTARRPAGAGNEDSKAEAWLEIVDGVDYSAKVLIRHCLAKAAQASIDKSQEWVKLAQAVAAEDGISEVVVRFVSPEAENIREPDLLAERRRLAEDRLARLESFVQLAELVVSEWRRDLMPDPTPIKAQGRLRSKVKRSPNMRKQARKASE